MNIEVKKITKIISEMVTFVMLGDAEKVDVSIENEQNMFKLLINAKGVNRTSESVDNLRELLNAPRQRAAEEYYWGLAGDNDMTTEIALVGMMTDKAIVKYENNNLLIELHRYK